jgi:hypothetical protein
MSSAGVAAPALLPTWRDACRKAWVDADAPPGTQVGVIARRKVELAVFEQSKWLSGCPELQSGFASIPKIA